MVAQFVVGGVQRNRQHGAGALAQLLDAGRDAGRAHRDAAARDGNAVAIRYRVDCGGDVVQIVQRLAHAHEHDVGERPVAVIERTLRRGPLAQRIARDQHLRDDLLRGQVAHQFLRAGVAESAVQRAADLRTHAQRARAAHIGDKHGLALDAGPKTDQPLARAVLGHLRRGDFRPRQRVMLRERRAQLLGDIGHRRKIRHAIMINPTPKLLGAHPRLLRLDADGDQPFSQLGLAEAGEGGFRGFAHGYRFALRCSLGSAASNAAVMTSLSERPRSAAMRA